jgi:hypothetical protein
MVDENGTKIHVGDKLQSEWGYFVIVNQSEDGDFFGKLICDVGDSCENIPYHLNNGSGYYVLPEEWGK